MSKLSEQCLNVYVQTGQSGVFDFVTQNYPKISWEWCEPCEVESPAENHECLVCSTPTKPLLIEDND